MKKILSATMLLLATATVAWAQCPTLTPVVGFNLCEITGYVSVQLSNNNGTSTYLWSTGHTTQTVNGLPSGAYDVTVTTTIGNTICTDSTEAILNVPGIPAPNLTTGFVPCVNNSGFASSTPTGGIPPYSWLWSNGATTPTIQNLPSGTYTVTVSDVINCTATASIVVTSGAPLPVPQFGYQPIACDTNVTTACLVNWADYTAITWLPSGSHGACRTNLLTNTTYQIILGTPTCTDTLSFTTDGPITGPTITATITDSLSCVDSLATISATEDSVSVNLWWLTNLNGDTIVMTGTMTATVEFDSLVAGTYIVHGCNLCMCIGVDTLTILPPDCTGDTTTIVEYFCWGDSVQILGTWYAETTTDTILTPNPIPGITDTTFVFAIELDSVQHWDTTIVACSLVPGTLSVSDTLSNWLGCDSLINTITTVYHPIYNINQSASFCVSNYYIWQGDTLTMPGIYDVTLASAFGCDSTITLTLTVLPSTHIDTSIWVCPGDSALFAGNYYPEGDTLLVLPGTGQQCDTTVNLSVFDYDVPTDSIGPSINTCVPGLDTLITFGTTADGCPFPIYQLYNFVPNIVYDTAFACGPLVGHSFPDTTVVAGCVTITWTYYGDKVFTLGAKASPAKCDDGGKPTGAIALTQQNGAEPITYTMNGLVVQPPLTGLESGLYNFQATDADSCTANVTIEVPWDGCSVESDCGKWFRLQIGLCTEFPTKPDWAMEFTVYNSAGQEVMLHKGLVTESKYDTIFDFNQAPGIYYLLLKLTNQETGEVKMFSYNFCIGL